MGERDVAARLVDFLTQPPHQQIDDRTKRNYETMITRYLSFCREQKMNVTSTETAYSFLIRGLTQKSWSKSYVRLYTRVLQKYVLDERLNFGTLMRSVPSNVISNRFDTQCLNKEQVVDFLTRFNAGRTNKDLFLLFSVLNGAGLRFAETKQLSGQDLINLFNGESVSIISAKTNEEKCIQMLPEFRVGGDLKINDRSVGDIALEMLRYGFRVIDRTGKPTTVNGSHEEIFFKNYESYRNRFTKVKDDVVVGGGTGRNNTNRGMALHVGRRTFGTTVYDRLNDLNEEDRIRALSRALRHNSAHYSMRYVRPNVNNVDNAINRLFSNI